MRTLRNYFWWTYERGSFHYDVMVTLILLFLFIAPRFINFADRPQPSEPPRKNEIHVWQKDATHLGYEVPLTMLRDTSSDAATRSSLDDALAPFAASPNVTRYSMIYDDHGHIVAYDTTLPR